MKINERILHIQILHLHVKEKYYKEVKENKKFSEYRLYKPYWIKRLAKDYDLIYYWRAYTKEKLIFKYSGKLVRIIEHPEFGDKPVKVFDIPLFAIDGVRE